MAQAIVFTQFYGAFGHGVGFRALVDGRIIPCMITGAALNVVAPDFLDTPLEQFRRKQDSIHETARSLIQAGQVSGGLVIIQPEHVKPDTKSALKPQP
jgi:hypothetical protein